MPARLDDDGSRLGDVDTKHFKEHGVGRLAASGDHDHRDSPDLQRSGWSNINTTPLQQTEPANEAIIAESNHVRLSLEGNIPVLPGRMAPIAVEPCSKLRPYAQACASAGSAGSKNEP